MQSQWACLSVINTTDTSGFSEVCWQEMTQNLKHKTVKERKKEKKKEKKSIYFKDKIPVLIINGDSSSEESKH